MRIVIVGGGVVGYSLARQLLHDKHTVILIEQTPDIAEHIAEKMDLQVLSGSGSSPTVLQQAGIENADMVIAVTPVDEINILVCSIARQYGVTQRIARLRNREFISPDRHVSLIDLGVTQFIFPEQVVVDSILQYIDTPGAREAVNFEDGNIFLRGYQIVAGMPIVGKSLIELRGLIEPNIFLVAAVIRDGKGIIPPGEFVIEAGDKVFSLFPREVAPRFMELIYESPAPVKRVIITGNNLSTMQLASAIQEKVPTLILADPDKEHAELMAAELSKTDVIFGDCTEADTLKEMDINRADFFIASSNEADYNMLSALLAKSEGAREVIAVSMDEKQDHLFHSIGIDHVINPRVTAAKEIMQIISRGYFGSVVRLGDAEIEAVGMTIPENSKVVGIPLKKAWKKIRKGAIIGIIIRGDTMIIPDGETVLEGNDHIITIAYTTLLPSIRKLFKSTN
ncbi:MAG: Trk system potassium transporter TrkA [candidate division Zixibacteria bacterium]